MNWALKNLLKATIWKVKVILTAIVYILIRKYVSIEFTKYDYLLQLIVIYILVSLVVNYIYKKVKNANF